jgi:SAM-dependent methyltransferase
MARDRPDDRFLVPYIGTSWKNRQEDSDMISADEIIERNRTQDERTFWGAYKPWERVSQALWHMPRTPGTIVDVGCHEAAGTALLRIAHPKARLIAVECVPERAEMARSVCDEVHECFFQSAPIPAASADVVFSGEVIEHVTYDDAESFVAAAARALRPGGNLILTTPNPRYVLLWIKGKSILDEPSHLSQWTVGQLSRLVERHGFKVRRVEGTGKVSRMIGTIWPIVPLYGSYMLIADRL